MDTGRFAITGGTAAKVKASRRILAWLLSIAALIQFVQPAKACGPETIQPLFVMAESPDPPFREFTQGKIGILKPTFGRKTLTIAYRYLNGGVFNAEEQQALVEALKGLSPEADDGVAVKAWIAARKTILENETELPDVYRERRSDGYDFFPNCTGNAFEVATETLKDRASRFGSESTDVRAWLEGQDIVFRNCAEGSVMPRPIGPESPVWLRKDRDYQIAAAVFYSLDFDEARQRFERIAQDAESEWQQMADYLVGRTLVRQASLESNETAKRARYENAETYLINLVGRATKLRNGSRKLLALVKYRLRPEERVRELAQVLTLQSGNDNLRQDLIDYVWLLNKFDQQIQMAEAEREKLLNPPNPETATEVDSETEARRAYLQERTRIQEAVWQGKLIEIWFYPRKSDGSVDPSGTGGSFVFQPDASEREIVQAVEAKFGRKLTPEEARALTEGHAQALETRKFWLSPNRKWNRGSEYDGCAYQCNDIKLDQLPSFLRSDELSDWIFTFQSAEPEAYSHALEKWRETQSPAWLVAALAKADKTSPSVKRILTEAEKIQPDAPIFATALYHRIRLYIDLARRSEARQLLDDIIVNRLDSFPVSTQNQLFDLRMELAESLTEFLRFSTRKPVTFYEYGVTGTISDILKVEMAILEGELDERRQERLRSLLAWDDRTVFDERTSELLNWHFPLSELLAAAHDSVLPDYLRQRMLLTSWTRAVLLKNDDVAHKAAVEIVDKVANAPPLFQRYLRARTSVERDEAATFILLKWPNLSPYLSEGIPETSTSEEAEYYFELSWWCALIENEYDAQGNEVPKQVRPPAFLTSETLSTASKERSALIAVGDAKRLLGKRVLEWAKRDPRDPRLPEALFIAAKANESYKYGCGGWEQDEELRGELERVLKAQYAGSSWAAKLDERD